MDIKSVSPFCSLLAKDYAEDFFRLLATHQNISASEAASRLDLHIKTAQDFLEGLHQQNIVAKEEVNEGKRPYFRYSLVQKKLSIEIDVSYLYDREKEEEKSALKIRERKNSGAAFKTNTKNDSITSIQFFIGTGRNRAERKINLTQQQGRFLFHLPFPTEDCMPVVEIMKNAKIDSNYLAEIINIVEFLDEHQIIEREG